MSVDASTGKSNSIADARSALMDSIRSLTLEQHFGRAALRAAQTGALHTAQWHGPVAWYQPDGSQAEALDAELTDSSSARRRITVYLYAQFGATAVESSCTCGTRLCEHAASLLIRLQRLADWPRPMTPLQRWQYMLKSPAQRAPRAEPDPLEARRLICLLDASGQPLSALMARLILLASPADLHERERWIALDELSPDANLSPRFALWQARLSRGSQAPGASGGHQLRGADGAALLAEWLQADICRHAQTLQSIREGPPRRPRWQWSLDQEARAHLRMQLAEDGSAYAISLDGIRYLDETSGELGPLTLDVQAWSMIERLPPIPPGDASLRDDWPPHPLLKDIPPPPPSAPLATHRAPLEPVVVIGAARRLAQDDFIFYVRAWADYSGCRLRLAEQPWQEQVIRSVAGQFTTVHRDVARELAAKKALAGLDLMPLRTLIPDASRTLTPAPAADAMAHREHHRGGAETLAALDSVLRSGRYASFRVECDPKLPFVVLPEQTPLRATFRAGHSAGWTQFQLTAACEEGEIDVLPIVLNGLRSRAFSLSPQPQEHSESRWLAPIGADRFLPLRLSLLREWLTPLLAHATTAVSSDARQIDLPVPQAMSLSTALERQDVAVGGPQAARMLETLASLRAAQKTSCSPPTAFQGSLRQYQKEGLQWLQALRHARLGGILADDMGLGKTVQIIAHLSLEWECGRLDRPALVIASTSLVPNWLDELARFAPALRRLAYTGAERARQRTRLPSAHVIVISYALLNHELTTLQSIDYSMIVLDEAQWIKNPFAQTARAIRALRAPHVVAVTGTPLENHLGELWTHMDATNPGYLGDYRSFNHQFRNPIERHEDDRRLAALRHLVSPFVLRRTKAEVAPELPSKTETVVRVAMGDDQRRLYESLRLSLSHEVRAAVARYTDEQSRIVVLTALMRLRQVCCDPRLIERTGGPAAPSAKLDALLALIRLLTEQRQHVLVFSQFTSMLGLIARALEHGQFRYTMLTGKTADRRTPVQEFQSGKARIMLASLKAGGLGLNLTAADAVIHYDPWWNPAVERQASDRAHRLGREQPVFIYKLICEDTIEEKIAAMKDRKSDLALAVLGEKQFRAGRLSELDLRELFNLPTG
jgi:superfamily II DNA or RNA helicase